MLPPERNTHGAVEKGAASLEWVGACWERASIGRAPAATSPSKSAELCELSAAAVRRLARWLARPVGASWRGKCGQTSVPGAQASCMLATSTQMTVIASKKSATRMRRFQLPMACVTGAKAVAVNEREQE